MKGTNIESKFKDQSTMVMVDLRTDKILSQNSELTFGARWKKQWIDLQILLDYIHEEDQIKFKDFLNSDLETTGGDEHKIVLRCFDKTKNVFHCLIHGLDDAEQFDFPVVLLKFTQLPEIEQPAVRETVVPQDVVPENWQELFSKFTGILHDLVSRYWNSSKVELNLELIKESVNHTLGREIMHVQEHAPIVSAQEMRMVQLNGTQKNLLVKEGLLGKIEKDFVECYVQMVELLHDLNAKGVTKQSNNNRVDREEKIRLNERIHDGICQDLSAISMRMAAYQLQNRIDMDDFVSIKNALDKTTDNLRSIAREIMPKSLMSYGLGESIQAMISEVNERMPECQIEYNNHIDNPSLENSDIMFAEFQRLFKELTLMSTAKRISVSATSGARGVRLEAKELDSNFISGFTMSDETRKAEVVINRVGGKLVTASIPGSGNKFVLEFPLSINID